MKKEQMLSRLGVLVALLTAAAVSGLVAQDKPFVRVEGIEEGAIYFEPVSPKVVVPLNLGVIATELNDQPYDGGEIADQGLHTFSVTASDTDGQEFSSTTRFIVLDPAKRAPVYTMDLVRYHVERLARHPQVTPTPSADQRLVVGTSRGWPKDPEVPEHDVFGFQITDAEAEGAKLRVVLVGGNHPGEHTGNWTLHGGLDFLVSDDPRAAELRRWAVFYVYPMVNPDGRYALSGRSNPEMRAQDVSDHNRVWNTSGRFSTIDAVTSALKADTGGSTDYLLDFHSAGDSFFFVGADFVTSPYARAMTARDPEIKPRRSDGHPGMVRNWSMTEEGLNARFGYTPETAGGESGKRSLEIGRSYLLAFHDLISGSAALAAAAEILEQESPPAFGAQYRRQLPELKENLERVLPAGKVPVHDTLEVVYALYEGINAARECTDLAAEAENLMASARRLVDESPLTLGTWLHDEIAATIGALTNLLADPGAERESIRTQTQTLAGAMAGIRSAEAAEAVVATASEVLGQTDQGFAQLYQNGVRRRADALVKLLKTPGTPANALTRASRSLEEAMVDYWKVRTAGTTVPLRPVQVADVPQVLEVGTRADWEQGFLINVAANDDGLVLADRPTLTFDGDGDYVETGFHPGESNLGQQFTWEFWKKYRVFANETGSSGTRGTSPRFYTQLAGSDGELRTAIGDSYWTSTTLKEPDTWYHIAVVFDNGVVRTYVDGELRDTRSDVKFSGDSTSPFAIGRGFGTGRWLDGASREHRIWNTARNEAEIRQNRYRQFEGSEVGLVGYWRLDEGENSQVRDRTAGGNHGTIHEATWQRHSLPGFRISRPIAIGTGVAVADVTVTWEIAGKSGDGETGVTVWAGLSKDEAVLPETWNKAASGDSLSALAKRTKFAGSYLWVKQELTPRKSEAPVVLRRLAVNLN